jgi:cyclin-dependent kinase 2
MLFDIPESARCLVLEFLADCYVKDVVISNRRNKGVLSVAVNPDRSIHIIRSLDCVFFNSGTNDGIPSSVLREICILKDLHHVNVVSLLKWSCFDSTVNIIFPYYPFKLRDFLKKEREPLENRDISVQLLRAVSFIHSQKILHRNLRPSNILYDPLGRSIKVADFSAARFSSSRRSYSPEEPRTRQRTLIERNRLIYKAPEILLGRTDYSYETDMFSVGIILSKILSHPLSWILDLPRMTESEYLLRVSPFLGRPFYEWQSRTAFCKCSLPFLMMKESVTIATVPPVISNLICFPPSRRWSAQDSLDHLLNSGYDTKMDTPFRNPVSCFQANLNYEWRYWAYRLVKFFDSPNSVFWQTIFTAENYLNKGLKVFRLAIVIGTSFKLCMKKEVSKDFFKTHFNDKLAIHLRCDPDEINRCEVSLITHSSLSQADVGFTDPAALFLMNICVIYNADFYIASRIAPIIAGTLNDDQHKRISDCSKQKISFEKVRHNVSILEAGLSNFKSNQCNLDDLRNLPAIAGSLPSADYIFSCFSANSSFTPEKSQAECLYVPVITEPHQRGIASNHINSLSSCRRKRRRSSISSQR